jgi:hypothetical protein
MQLVVISAAFILATLYFRQEQENVRSIVLWLLSLHDFEWRHNNVQLQIGTIAAL